MNFFEELKRRNVFRVGIAYVLFAWVILQGADFVLDLIGAANWVIQALSITAVCGLPVVLIVSWVFELTPEGIKLEKDIDRSHSITSKTGRKLDRVIIGVLALAVIYLLVDKLILQDLSITPESTTTAESLPPVELGPSVAVLPFVNMSGDKENEYFSDGLTETLLHMLSQIPELRVAARTSSFAFKGQNASIEDIAATLGVAHILEGSVQKADDRVRVTAQLIRANDGFHVWSQNYTRPLEDIFVIQDEIATDVASELGSSLLGSAKPRLRNVSTTNLSAYDSYLKGSEQQAIYSWGSLDEAEVLFKQALASDPGFSDARLALARNYLLKFITGLVDKDEVRVLAEPLIKQTLEQEPENSLARALELTLQLLAFDHLRGAEYMQALVDELLEILQLNPTETLIRTVTAQTIWQYFNNEQQAIEVLQAGLMIDPMASELHRNLGGIYAAEERFEEARITLQRSLELAPDNPNSYSELSHLERESGNLPAALDWMRQASLVDPQDPEFAAFIAEDLFALELPEEGDYWYARVQALVPGSPVARKLEIQREIARGNTERAIELAASAIADQVQDRRNAFGYSVFQYANLMMKEGRAQEAYEFLVSVKPEIVHYNQLAEGMHGLIMQWASIAMMSGFSSFEERKASWNQFTAELDAIGFPWKNDPADQNNTWDFLMNGDVEAAIGHFLEYELTDPVAMNLDRHKKNVYLVFAPVYEDPRVAASLNDRARLFAELRNEISSMLQQREWDNS